MAPPRKRDTDPLVTAILNETKAGEDEHRKRIEAFDRSYEVYRASAPLPPMAPYRSRLRPKYGMHVIDIAMVNMVQGKPYCKVLPRTPDYIGSARKFERGINYFGDMDKLAEKNVPFTQQALIYGVTGGKTDWVYQTGKAVPRRDPATGIVYGGEQDEVLRDGPGFTPWDVYDLWWEPNARDVDDAEYVAFRSWPSKDYLERNRCTTKGDHEWHECDGLYHNLDQLYLTGRGKKPATSAQNSLLGGQGNLYKDRFEVIEYWRDNRLVVTGNRQIVLRDVPNFHWHGKKPAVIVNCRPDLFKIMGVPETELVDDIQQALWMIENIRQENIHLTTWRAFTLRQTADTQPGDIEIKPRAIIPVSDHDDLKAVEIPPLPPEAYEEEQVLLQRLQEITGITSYITGAAAGSVDQNTATGISILNSAASVLLKFKAGQVQKGWQRVFEQWGNDIQQFLTQDVWIRLTGPDAEALAGPGAKFAFDTMTPTDVVGEYDFVLEGTEESLSKAQVKQDAIALATALMPAIQAGLVNPKPIYEQLARAFGFDNVEALFTPAAPVMPPAAPHNGNQPPVPPQGQMLTNGMPLPSPVAANVLGGGQ